LYFSFRRNSCLFIYKSKIYCFFPCLFYYIYKFTKWYKYDYGKILNNVRYMRRSWIDSDHCYGIIADCVTNRWNLSNITYLKIRNRITIKNNTRNKKQDHFDSNIVMYSNTWKRRWLICQIMRTCLYIYTHTHRQNKKIIFNR
jgi:hypothetical protein